MKKKTEIGLGEKREEGGDGGEGELAYPNVKL